MKTRLLQLAIFLFGLTVGSVDILATNVTFTVKDGNIPLNGATVRIYSQNDLGGTEVVPSQNTLNGACVFNLSDGYYSYIIKANTAGYADVTGYFLLPVQTNIDITYRNITFTVKEGANNVSGNGTLTITQNDCQVNSMSSNNGAYSIKMAEGMYTYTMNMQDGRYLPIQSQTLVPLETSITLTYYDVTFTVKDGVDNVSSNGELTIIQNNNQIGSVFSSNGIYSLKMPGGIFNYLLDIQDPHYTSTQGQISVPTQTSVTLLYHNVSFVAKEGINNISSNGELTITQNNDWAGSVSSSNGIYSIRMIEGTYDYNLSIPNSNYASAQGQISVPTQTLITLTYYNVTFTAKEGTNNISQGGNVTIMQNGDQIGSISSNNGSYSIKVFEGNYDYRLSINNTNYANIRGVFSVPSQTSINLTYHNVTFTAKDGASNMSTPGSMVTISQNNNPVGFPTSNNGLYSIKLGEGDYNYNLFTNNNNYKSALGHISVPEQTAVDIIYRDITFTIKDGNNNTTNAAIRVTDAASTSLIFNAAVTGGVYSTKMADNLYSYKVGVTDASNFTETEDNFSISGQTSVNITYHNVTFTVKDGLNPITNGNIEIDDWTRGRSLYNYHTDSNGKMIVKMANGDYLYSTDINGYVGKSSKFNVNNNNVDIDINFAAYKTVTFTITNAQNNGIIAGIDILDNDGEHFTYKQTNSNGTATFRLPQTTLRYAIWNSNNDITKYGYIAADQTTVNVQFIQTYDVTFVFTGTLPYDQFIIDIMQDGKSIYNSGNTYQTNLAIPLEPGNYIYEIKAYNDINYYSYPSKKGTVTVNNANPDNIICNYSENDGNYSFVVRDASTNQLLGIPVNIYRPGQWIATTSISYSPMVIKLPSGSTYTYIVNKENSNGGKIISYDYQGAEGAVTISLNTIKLQPAKLVTGFSVADISMPKGYTRQLEPTIIPADATHKSIKWNSLNPDIVSVDAYGNVTAIAEGKAIVKAMLNNNNNLIVYCEVTVTPYVATTAITLSETSLNMVVGGTATLTATTQPIAGAPLTWNITPTGVISYDAVTGIVTALNSGTATITATSSDGPTASCTVTVASATGTNDRNIPQILIYPNPFAGTLHLTGAEGCILRVVNITGKTVYTQRIVDSDQSIDLANLPAGMYFFRLEKGGQVQTIKAIKQ